MARPDRIAVAASGPLTPRLERVAPNAAVSAAVSPHIVAVPPNAFTKSMMPGAVALIVFSRALIWLPRISRSSVCILKTFPMSAILVATSPASISNATAISDIVSVNDRISWRAPARSPDAILAAPMPSDPAAAAMSSRAETVTGPWVDMSLRSSPRALSSDPASPVVFETDARPVS